MFETSPESEARMERIVEVLKNYGRGDTITHEVLVPIVGCGEDMRSYHSIMYRARLRFERETGICSNEVVKIGYHLQTQQETLTFEQAKRAKKARSQIRKGSRAARHLPDKELTFHQRKLKVEALKQAKESRRLLIQNEEYFSAVTAQPPVMPRRKWTEAEKRIASQA